MFYRVTWNSGDIEIIEKDLYLSAIKPFEYKIDKLEIETRSLSDMKKAGIIEYCIGKRCYLVKNNKTQNEEKKTVST